MRKEVIIFYLELRVCTNRHAKTRLSHSNVKVVSTAIVTIKDGIICLDFSVCNFKNRLTTSRIEEALGFTKSKIADDRIRVESVVDILAVTSRAKNQEFTFDVRPDNDVLLLKPAKSRARGVRKKKVVHVSNQQALIF